MIPRDVAYREFAAALERLVPGWTVLPDGIAGPHGARVVLGDRHPDAGEGHVDVEFVVDGDAREPVRLVDCVSGSGATPADRARRAARIWAETTAGACCELAFSRRGRFADHYRGRDAGGLTGWHTIAGAVLAYGTDDSAGRLQRWWLDHPVLPALVDVLAPTLRASPGPHGIKLLCGGPDVAEVRVDGERHDAASAALLTMGWPRVEPPGFVRTFVIALHPDDGASRPFARMSLPAAAWAMALGVLWHVGIVVTVGPGAPSWGRVWLGAPAGAVAGLVAGWLTLRSRVRNEGRERWFDGFVAYYAAVAVWTIVGLTIGGMLDSDTEEPAPTFFEELGVVWIGLYYAVVAATVLGVVLVPACFVTRALFWGLAGRQPLRWR